jgi:hypothetical protein
MEIQVSVFPDMPNMRDMHFAGCAVTDIDNTDVGMNDVRLERPGDGAYLTGAEPIGVYPAE